MDEDDVWDALEDLHGKGHVDHVPSIGDVDSPQFSLTGSGEEYAEQLIRENDDAAMMILALAIQDVDRPKDDKAVAQAIQKAALILREEVGVNIFRVLKRHPKGGELVRLEKLDEEFVAQFDPEGVDDGGV